MTYNIANMEEVGLYTVSQLSERTGVAKATLEMWVRRQWLPVAASGEDRWSPPHNCPPGQARRRGGSEDWPGSSTLVGIGAG